ncbi:MAG TPA: M24 family metallopeptidase [Thermoleophilaceae bacterium]
MSAAALSDRVHEPVSTGELERRWSALRSAMEREGIDALVMHTSTDCLGGYAKYVSDTSTADGYPLSVVFPRDAAMTLVTHGPHGAERTLGPDGDGLLRGVRAVRSTWSFSSAHYCRHYDAEAIVKALEPYARGAVGLVGTTQMPHPLVEHLRRELPRAEFSEASDLVDRVKAIKSDEEKDGIRRAAALQTAAFEAALAAIEPGRREWDVVVAAETKSRELGSEYGVLMIGSAPPGEPALPNVPRHQNRTIQAGDRLTLLVESAGPGGLFTELGRMLVVGKATDAMHEEFEFALGAQRFCRELLVPGASSAEVFDSYNAYLREHGRDEERRLHCHGQGYDIVERPLVRSDESMALAEHMNIACHPMYVRDGVMYWVCDGFLIGPDGASEPLHDVPQKIFELA